MKKIILILSAVVLVTSCWEVTLPEEPGATSGKTVIIAGTQSNVLISGEAGTATFTVSTSNIAASATGMVQWYDDVAGISPIDAGQLHFVLISASVSTGSATRTLTVSIGSDSAPGIYWFRVTIDGVQSSNVGVLVIGEKTVVVGTQEGTVEQRAGGTATYTVTTTYIDMSEAGFVNWYSDAAGVQYMSAPPPEINFIGSPTVSTGSETRTLTFTVGPASGAAGTFYFRVTVGDVESNVGMLQIN